jgi:hypothetical protein
MAVEVVTRCTRCGTRLRGSRPACPSCGKDIEAVPVGVPVGKAAPGAGPGKGPRAPAKPGKVMCPVCFKSVPEAELIEHDGQKICTSCQELLKKKGGPPAGGPPPSKH